MSGLTLKGIVQRFGDNTVLHGIDLDVELGEFMVLVGPSGCGKSTLLRIVAGLVPATEGTLELEGRSIGDLEPRDRDVAMVFQNYALYPHMSVRKNLAFPLTLRKEPKAEIAGKVAKTATLLGLEELLERKPKQLSGGQMQRVAVGRAIIRNPRLFLFDEPLSNLDAKLRAEMRGEISRLHTELGITTLYVTHDQAEAMTLGQRVCVLRDGRIEQVGAPMEVFEKPATSFVASFIGSPAMNLLDGVVRDGQFTLGELTIPAPGIPGGAVTLGVRPHRIEPGGEQELLVRAIESLGTQTLIDLAVGDELLRVSMEGDHPVRCGEAMRVNLPPAALHWFDVKSGRRIE
jgi:ABC-type sugar transport system ATPase subunit